MPIAKTYEPLGHTTLVSASPNISFTNISGSYTDLVIVFLGAYTDSASNRDFIVRFNGDTGNNYKGCMWGINGSAINVDNINGTYGYVNSFIGQKPLGLEMNIMNYSDITNYKTLIGHGGNGSDYMGLVGGFVWKSTAAITSITIGLASGNLFAGSAATLYGIKKA